MKGLSIFLHSVRLVLNNLDVALRVSAVLYLVSAIVELYVALNFTPQLEAFDPDAGVNLDPSVIPAFFLSFAVALVTATWIAVAWHRYVLLEEVPVGWLPKWHGGAFLSYIWRSVLLAFVVVGAAMISMIPIGLLGTILPLLAPVFPLFSVAIGAYVFFRICPVLPAAAIGSPMTMSGAWAATRGAGGAILGLVLISVAASLVLQVPQWLSDNPTGAVSLLYGVVITWIATMIGISVFTTFFGHYVEGRSID